MIAGAAYSQQAVSEYGFTYVTPVAGSYVWTNDNAYPFKFDSMVFNSSVANTATVNRVRSYKVNQEVGWVVTTNDMGDVESNYYHQVTNVVTVAATNNLLSTTNSGALVYTSSDIKQIWIHFGDVIRWTFSDTSTNVLFFDTTR